MTSTLKNPVHTYEKAGTYFVTLTVSDGNRNASVTKIVEIEGGSNIWYYAIGGLAVAGVAVYYGKRRLIK